MKTLKVVLVTVASIIFLALSTLFLIGFVKPQPAGIFVDANPVADVYINNVWVGKTPYKGTSEPGEITLKMIPASLDKNLVPYESKITLVSGIQTVVRREFGETEDTSSGDVISFEKADKNPSLVVVSAPDNAQVSLDGVPRGFTPYKTVTISPAEHLVTIKAVGFLDRTITVKTLENFRLTVFAKLAKGNEEQGSLNVEPTPSPSPSSKTYVEILDTPTGFLRVRTAPASKGDEIAEVKPGSKYPYLETDAESGWYKIQYQEVAPGLPNGITGWVSNQYSKISTSSAALSN